MMAANGPRTVAAILVAAGSGERLGADVPKAFVVVAGRTLLQHAVTRFAGHPDIDRIVVVAPASHVQVAESSTGAIAGAIAGVEVVAGGATRQQSVQIGLSTLGTDVDLVLVHDVARPFVPDSVITAVIAALAAGADGAVPVVGIHDTVRRIDATGAFVGIVDRATLVAIQTPQGFDRAVLVEAHEAGRHLNATDDAALVEALGRTVVAVPGADEVFKITRPWDLAVAEAIATP